MDYKFSIQYNLRIGEIQSKSNPYVCELDADLTQFISNPSFYRLIYELKFLILSNLWSNKIKNLI